MLRRLPGSSSSIVIQYGKDKTVIGLTEKVTVMGPNGTKKTVLARMDTGAKSSSIDINLAAKLELGPILKAKRIKSASGTGVRPVVHAKIIIGGKEFEADVNLADREHMNYDLLIGQKILRQGFLIDPSKESD